MKDRRTIAAILAAALTLTMCGVSAVAAEEADSSAAPDSSVAVQADQADSSAAVGGTPEDASSGDTAADSSQAGKTGEDQAAQDTQDSQTEEHPEPELIPPDAVGTVSFANVSRRLRENNLSVLSLEENINAIKAIDYEKMGDDIRKSLNSIADAQWFMTISGNSFAAKSMSSSYESLNRFLDCALTLYHVPQKQREEIIHFVLHLDLRTMAVGIIQSTVMQAEQGFALLPELDQDTHDRKEERK